MLRERRWLILFITTVFTGTAIFFDSRSPTTWAPIAQVEIGQLTGDTAFLGIRPVKPDVSPQRAASRAAEAVTAPEVLDDARRRLGDRVPPEYSLDGRTLSGGRAGPGRVAVQVLDTDLERAILGSNTVADSVAAYINRRTIDRIEEVLATLRKGRRRIVRPRFDGDPRTFRRFVRRYIQTEVRLTELDSDIAALDTVRRIAEPAQVIVRATDRTEPYFQSGARIRPAFGIGFTLALILAFLLDRVGRRPRDLRQFTDAAGLPLVARIPRLGRRSRPTVELAYEHLRAAAEGLGDDGRARVVVVTSPEPGAGKSTVALGIARAAAVSGRPTCLLECDLHRPSLASRLGLNGPGLGDWLAGRSADEDLMHHVYSAAGGEPLTVVVAGTAPRHPAEALGGSEFRELVSSLAASHELVVIDAPPLLAVSDALALVPLADAVLLCARLGQTPIDELAAARAALDRLPRVPAALVVTGVRQKAAVLVAPRHPSYQPSAGAA